MVRITLTLEDRGDENDRENRLDRLRDTDMLPSLGFKLIETRESAVVPKPNPLFLAAIFLIAGEIVSVKKPETSEAAYGILVDTARRFAEPSEVPGKFYEKFRAGFGAICPLDGGGEAVGEALRVCASEMIATAIKRAEDPG